VSLFRWIAGSRVRLAIAALIGIAACVFLAAPAAEFIRYSSTSIVQNLFVRLGFAFLILTTATLLAVLVGDLVFPGRWRERIILGRNVAPTAPDDSLEAVKGLKSYYIHFSFMIAAFCVVGGVGIHSSTQLFSSRDDTRTTLRGDDVERKLMIITELAGTRTEREVNSALEILDTVWRDERQPTEVRRASLVALGELLDYLVQAVETWRTEGKRESWQGDIVLELRQAFADDLRRFQPGAPASLRPVVTFLLGAVQDVRANELILNELVAYPDDASDAWRAAIGALGAAHQADLLPAVVDRLDAGRSDTAYAILAWATQELVKSFYRAYGEPEKAPEALKEAVERAVAFFGAELLAESPERRCIAAELLRFTGHVAARDPLFAAFDAPGAKDIFCGTAKADVPAGNPGWIGTGDESLRARIVQAIATIARDDAKVGEWIRSRLAAGGLEETVEALLQQLAEQR
jgi:hypothetical protein